MFNQQELQILLGGVNSPIDLDDLRNNTQYGGLYDNHEATIQAFWRVRTKIHTRGMDADVTAGCELVYAGPTARAIAVCDEL